MKYKDNLMHNQMELRESTIALYTASYCKRGWPIHPLNGKIPLLKGWQKKASIDQDVVMQWFKQWPRANLGLLTGSDSNLLVLDVDGLDGAKSLAGLDLPKGPSVLTARGYHYYFRFPEALNNVPTTRTGLLPGIDTRGCGGFIVAPPSVHATGHKYTWIELLNDALPDAPSWLINLLRPLKMALSKRTFLLSDKATRYACAALRNESEAVAKAPVGMRNSRLNQAAFSIGTLIAVGSMDITYAAQVLSTAALNAGLSRSEINKTLASGLSAGIKKPREVSHG